MNLLLRVVSGAVLLALVVAALWFGLPWVAIVVGAAALIAAWEFRGIGRRMRLWPAAWILYPLVLWLAIRFALPGGWQTAEWPLLAAVVVALPLEMLLRRDIRCWAAALSGALYIGFTLGFFIAVFQWRPDGDHFGLRLVALPLLSVFAGDTAAYAAGSTLGRHGFFRSISPRKSVEGAVAGAAATIVVAALTAAPLVGLSPVAGAGLGALLTVAAQAGDLAESALKRQAEVKDSSALIPGHGGLLDRIDSLVLVGPVVYCYLKLIHF